MSDNIKNEIEENKEDTTLFTIFNMYLIESFEVFVVLIFFKIIVNKPLDFENTIKSSLFIGLIITMIGLYNTEIKKYLKLGLMTSMGSKLLN